MLNNSRRTFALLAGGVGLTLVLGVAVASGIVPRVGDMVSVAAGEATLTTAADPPAASTAPAPAGPPVTAPPTTKVAVTRAGRQPKRTTPTPTAPAAPAAPAAATPSPAVPRVNPPSAQVLQAMQPLSARSPLFKPTEAQARKFGDSVCTAFDQGSSNAQVKEAVIAAAGRLPTVRVSSADADYAIRTAVELTCPGHTSKLV